MINLKLPTPKQIKKARENAKLTQLAAAELVGMSHRAWQNWESETDEHRQMGLWHWRMFLDKTNQLGLYTNGEKFGMQGSSIKSLADAIEGLKMKSTDRFDAGVNAACDVILKMINDRWRL